MKLKQNLIKKIAFLSITFFVFGNEMEAQNKLHDILDDYMYKASAFGFSGGLLVEKNGEIILSKGYGFADKEYMVPFTDSTIIDIASCTKPFTSTAILKLYDEGKLDIKDKITKYFNDVPDDKTNITIHQLLSNSSGLSEYHFSSSDFSRDEQVKGILNDKFEGEPDKWYYSNSGFNLLAAIIEKVSKVPFEDYIRQNFINPLNINHAGFYGDKKWDDKFIGHSYNREKDYGSFANNINKWSDKGAGNMASSMLDIYKFVKASMSNEFLKEDTYKKQFTKYVDLNKNWSYGYGWFIMNSYRNTKVFRFGGNNTPSGITIEVRIFPEENTMYILFCNEMIDEIGLVRPLRDEIEKIMLEPNYENSLVKVNISPNRKQNGGFEANKIISYKNRIIIEPNLNNYIIKTENQEVINAITNQTPERKKLFLELNKKTNTLFKQLVAGTYEDKELQDYYWNKIKIKDFEVLCTLPMDEDTGDVTFVRVWKPEGQYIFRCLWDDNEFNYINDEADELPSWNLVKVGDNNFVGFDLILKKQFKITTNKKEIKIITKGHENIFD